MPVSVAARIFSRSVHGELGHRLAVAGEHGLERLDILELAASAPPPAGHAFEAVHHLRVHGMLDPERAVLVEGGDALLRTARNLRARPVGGGAARIRRSPAWRARRSRTAARRPAVDGLRLTRQTKKERSRTKLEAPPMSRAERGGRSRRKECSVSCSAPSDTRSAANCCSSGSSAFPWPGRSRSCPASAAAETPGTFAGAAPRSPAPEPGQTRARRTI